MKRKATWRMIEKGQRELAEAVRAMGEAYDLAIDSTRHETHETCNSIFARAPEPLRKAYREAQQRVWELEQQALDRRLAYRSTHGYGGIVFYPAMRTTIRGDRHA